MPLLMYLQVLCFLYFTDRQYWWEGLPETGLGSASEPLSHSFHSVFHKRTRPGHTLIWLFSCHISFIFGVFRQDYSEVTGSGFPHASDRVGAPQNAHRQEQNRSQQRKYSVNRDPQ